MEDAKIAIVGLFYLGLFSIAFHHSYTAVAVEEKENYLVRIKIREEEEEDSKPKLEHKPESKPKPKPESKPLTEQSIKDDVVACLRGMGSKKKEAVEAVNNLADTTKYVDAVELLKDIFKKP